MNLSVKKNNDNNVEDDFIPGIQESLDELKNSLVTGELLQKFMNKEIKFPVLPQTFLDHSDYKRYWLYLIQYEIFSKLLSQVFDEKSGFEDEENLV